MSMTVLSLSIVLFQIFLTTVVIAVCFDYRADCMDVSRVLLLFRALLIGAILLVQVVVRPTHALLHGGRGISTAFCRSLVTTAAPVLLGRLAAHDGAEIARDQVEARQSYQDNHQGCQEYQRRRADNYFAAEEIELSQYDVEMVCAQQIGLKGADEIRGEQVNTYANQIFCLKRTGRSVGSGASGGRRFLNIWL